MAHQVTSKPTLLVLAPMRLIGDDLHVLLNPPLDAFLIIGTFSLHGRTFEGSDYIVTSSKGLLK
jgi:hypothetical protein